MQKDQCQRWGVTAVRGGDRCRREMWDREFAGVSRLGKSIFLSQRRVAREELGVGK